MTGATGFTRAAGLAGMLAPLLGVVAFLDMRYSEPTLHNPRSRPDDGKLWFLGAMLAFAVFLVGLLVRHRARWWAGLAGMLVGLALALIFVGAAGGEHGLVSDAGVFGGLTMTAVMLGVFLDGALPRPAAFLVLVTERLGRDDEPRTLALVAMTIGMVGYTWLAWAMWRELSPGRWDEAEVPREAPVPA